MPIRIRKLIGAVALIALVIVWSLLAMAIAQPVLASANHLIEALYYFLAGLGWVLPAMPLIKWMSRPDSEPVASTPHRLAETRSTTPLRHPTSAPE